jgi:hypothetical protein
MFIVRRTTIGSMVCERGCADGRRALSADRGTPLVSLIQTAASYAGGRFPGRMADVGATRGRHCPGCPVRTSEARRTIGREARAVLGPTAPALHGHPLSSGAQTASRWKPSTRRPGTRRNRRHLPLSPAEKLHAARRVGRVLRGRPCLPPRSRTLVGRRASFLALFAGVVRRGRYPRGALPPAFSTR